MPNARPQSQPVTASCLETVSHPSFENPQANGGLFLPKDGIVNDLNIPFEEYVGKERIAGSNIDFTMYVPDKILHRNPIAFTNGYFATEMAYQGMARFFARNGVVAFTHQPAGAQQLLARFHQSHFGKPSKLSSQALWAVMRGGVRMAHELGVDIDEEFDLSGHSRGGQTATNVALHRPNRVRSVILNQPAGMYDHHTIELSGNVVPFFKHEVGDLPLRLVFDSARHMLRDVPRVIAEGVDVSNCRIRSNVERLAAHGIKTAMILGENDTLLSTQKIVALEQITDILAFYSGPEGRVDHTWPQTNPDEAGSAQIQLLKLLHNDASKDEKQLAIAA